MPETEESNLSDLLRLHSDLVSKANALNAEISKILCDRSSIQHLPAFPERLGFEEFSQILAVAHINVERISSETRPIMPIRHTQYLQEIAIVENELSAIQAQRDAILRRILGSVPCNILEVAAKLEFIVSYIISIPEIETEYFLFHLATCGDDLRRLASRAKTKNTTVQPNYI